MTNVMYPVDLSQLGLYDSKNLIFAASTAWKTDSDSDALCVSSDPANNVALCHKIIDPHMIPMLKIAKCCGCFGTLSFEL